MLARASTTSPTCAQSPKFQFAHIIPFWCARAGSEHEPPKRGLRKLWIWLMRVDMLCAMLFLYNFFCFFVPLQSFFFCCAVPVQFCLVWLRFVVRDAVPVQAFASASVVPSATVRGFDVSGGLNAGGAGRVDANDAVYRVDVDFSAAAARSSAVGEAVYLAMNPGPSGVVPSSLVEGATVSSHQPRHDRVPTPLLLQPPPPNI